MASRLATRYLPLESVFAERMDVRAIVGDDDGDGVRHMWEHLSHSWLAEFAAAA